MNFPATLAVRYRGTVLTTLALLALAFRQMRPVIFQFRANNEVAGYLKKLHCSS